MGYKPTHDFQSCALGEQLCAYVRPIREVIRVKVGSQDIAGMTKTSLYSLNRDTRHHSGGSHGVPQAVEGHNGQGKPLQEALMICVYSVHGALINKPGKRQRTLCEAVKHEERQSKPPIGSLRLERVETQPVTPLMLYGQNTVYNVGTLHAHSFTTAQAAAT